MSDSTDKPVNSNSDNELINDEVPGFYQAGAINDESKFQTYEVDEEEESVEVFEQSQAEAIRLAADIQEIPVAYTDEEE